MAQLAEYEARLVARLNRTQPIALGVGAVLAALGAAYVVWGIYMFDYRVDPRSQTAFDKPVVRIAFMYDRYQRTIDKIIPETAIEQLMLGSMQRGIYFSTGVMILLMRILLGALTAVLGLATLAVVMERRRLLLLITRLRE